MKNQSFIKNIFSIFSSNIFSIGLIFIAGILLPRMLGPQLLGKLNSSLALASIVYSISFLGIRSSMIIILGRNKYPQEQVFAAIFYIFIFSVFLSTLILLVFFYFISNDFYSVSLVLLICLLNPFEFVISYLSGFTLTNGKIHLYNKTNWLPKIIYLIAILVLIGVFKLQVKGALIAILISNLISVFVLIRSLKLTHPYFQFLPVPVSLIKELVSLGIIYALTLLTTRLNYRIDILLLKRMCDISEVGFYSLGVNIAETIWQIPMAVGLVLMARSATDKNQKLVSRQLCATLRVAILIVLPVAIILFFFAPYLITLIYGEKFIPSIAVVRTILPGILFFVILKIVNSQFIGTGQPQLTLWALIPSMVINIGLNLLLIPAYKGIGAAIATNISYFTGSLILVIIYSKTFSVSITEIFRYQKSDFKILRQVKMKYF